jgi:hypothetical protein
VGDDLDMAWLKLLRFNLTNNPNIKREGLRKHVKNLNTPFWVKIRTREIPNMKTGWDMGFVDPSENYCNTSKLQIKGPKLETECGAWYCAL